MRLKKRDDTGWLDVSNCILQTSETRIRPEGVG
jgi:hypothetical protein